MGFVMVCCALLAYNTSEHNMLTCVKCCAHCFHARTPPAGKTVKCADVDSEMRQSYADSYKNCADKEVLQGGSTGSTGGAPPQWAQMSNMDVAGKDIPSGGKSFTEVWICRAGHTTCTQGPASLSAACILRRLSPACCFSPCSPAALCFAADEAWGAALTLA